MGFGGISIWQLVIIVVIVVLLFGTKKLRNLGGDLGSAVKGFKKAMNDDSDKADQDAEKKSIEQDAGFADQKPQDAAKSEQKSDNK